MKYRILTETKIVDGHTLYRIQRISDGALGGWIEKERNLSQDGNCWVGGEACVYGDAQVSESAQVLDLARVSSSARVFNVARVFGLAWVSDLAKVSGFARVCGSSEVYGSSMVSDSAWVCGSARIFDSARVSNLARVYGSALVFGSSVVSGEAQVFGDVRVCDEAQVCGQVQLRFGRFTSDCRTDHAAVIRCGVTPTPFVDGKITLYKRVFKTYSPNVWVSCHDSNFTYYKGRARTVKNPNMDWEKSCASGLHLSHVDYWDDGNALIACEVELKDIICVQEGKVRCKRIAKVLGAVS